MKRRQTRLWFKAKRYGWGWTPITWQGWLITLGFAILYALLGITLISWLGAATEALAVDYRGVSLSILEFLAAIALLTYALVRICTRYGEKPGWRWGDTDKK